MANVAVCDICGARNPFKIRRVRIGEQTCPASARTEEITRSFDVCGECCAYLLNGLVKRRPTKHEVSQYFLNFL